MIVFSAAFEMDRGSSVLLDDSTVTHLLHDSLLFHIQIRERLFIHTFYMMISRVTRMKKLKFVAFMVMVNILILCETLPGCIISLYFIYPHDTLKGNCFSPPLKDDETSSGNLRPLLTYFPHLFDYSFSCAGPATLIT